MRTPPVRLLVAGALLAATAPHLTASAGPPVPSLPHVRVLPVQARALPVSAYVTRGLAPPQAVVQAQLDRLALAGVAPALLDGLAADQAAQAAQEDGDVIVVGPGAPQAARVYLSSAGDLDRRGGDDVLEQRYSNGDGKQQRLQVRARSGRTGALLWTRTVEQAGGFAAAIPTLLGPRQQPGVLVLGFSSGFGSADDGVVLVALDGAGRQLWRRTLSSPGGDKEETGNRFSYTSTYVDFARALRRSAPDELVTHESTTVTESDTGTETESSRVAFHAVSSATGALRAVPGGATSPDGSLSGLVVGDQDGDGLDELAVVDAGGASRATVLRAVDGKVVWQRSDLPLHEFGVLLPAGRVTGGRTQDLVLLTGSDPGLVGYVDTPLGTIGDPTAAAHGTVALLRTRTGATVWSRDGDEVDLVERAGVPAVGVVTATTSETLTEAVETVVLDVVDAAGAVRWSRTLEARAPQTPDSFGSAFGGGFAGAPSDLDGDGSRESELVAYVFSYDDFAEAEQLLRGSDGTALRDQDSALLYGGVGRTGEDRVTVVRSAAGLVVTVLRGRDSARLWRTTVPGSKGVEAGRAYASGLVAGPCSDVLVAGTGGGREVVAVLASNGGVRWSVGRPADDRPGSVTTPRAAPRPRC